jgi:hypothetical protein
VPSRPAASASNGGEGDRWRAPARMGGVRRLLRLTIASLALVSAAGAPAADRTQVGAGMSVVVPAGWRAALHLTGLAEPFERFTLASFPLHRPADYARRCGPTQAVSAMPAGGALAFVFEYGPHGQSGRHFPPQPARFTLPAGPARPYECFGLGWLLNFRVAKRPFQVMIALGRRAGPNRARLLRALSSLRVDPEAGSG